MLPIYFPTNIKHEGDVLVAAVDWPSLGKLYTHTSMNGKGSRYPQEPVDKGLMSRDELDTSAFIINDTRILPVELCTILQEETNQPIMGMDPTAKEMVPLIDKIKPIKYASCHMWGRLGRIESIFFNLFARATGLNSTDKIPVPRNTRHNFHNMKKFSKPATPEILKPKHHVEEEDKGLVLHEKVWYRYIGKNLFDIKTGELKHEGIDTFTAVAVMPENNSSRNYAAQKPFSFKEPYTSRFNLYGASQNLILNHVTSLTDPDFGKTFFDSLGISYDIYDKVTFDEDGQVDTSAMLDGKYDFAVQKRTCLVIDHEAVLTLHAEGANYLKSKAGMTTENLISDLTKETDNLDKRVDFFDFARHDNIEFALANASEIITIRPNITKDLKVKFCKHWEISNIIAAINKAFDGYYHEAYGLSVGSTPDRKNAFGYGTPKEVQLDIFEKITKKVDIYLPILTPRFSNEVCSLLKAYYISETPKDHNLVMDYEYVNLNIPFFSSGEEWE